MSGRTLIPAGGPWAERVAYSRAIRVGDLIEVAGTTAVSDSGEVLHPGDAYAQARAAFAIVLDAVRAAGGGVEDVVRTRAYLLRIADWEDVGRAHGEIFHHVAPVSTMVGVDALLLDGLLVEVEATAICSRS